jgi:Uncharacterized conserved protein
MALKEQLQADLKEAMKGGRAEEVGVLRMIISAAHNKEIDKQSGAAFDDAAVEAVLRGEAKKRKEAGEAFEKGGRTDLAEKERSELSIIQKYLPAEISSEEVDREVQRILSEGVFSEFGLAMKAVMAVLRGKADAGMVQASVKKYLESK